MSNAAFNPFAQATPPAAATVQASEAPALAPPNAPELERAVIGAILNHPASLPVIAATLKTSEAFYQPVHRMIFEAALALSDAGQATDFLSVQEQLRTTGRYTTALGQSVAALARETASASPETHCKTLLEYYALREVMGAAQGILRQIHTRTVSPLELVAQAQQRLSSCLNVSTTRQAESMERLYDPVFDRIRDAARRKGIVGVACGILEIDKITNGFQAGKFIIIAGRPGMGKSSFMLQMARNMAVDFNSPGAIFSLEMSNDELTTKLVALETECTANELTKGKLPDGVTLEELQKRGEKLRTRNILLDEESYLTISLLRAKASRLKAEHNIEWLFIDYLQLMNGEGNSNREQQVSDISRGCKQLSRDLGIPVIALAQLSRKVEDRTDKRPIPSDLRESGSLEQDADMIIFPFRPEYYKITEDELGNPTAGTAEIIIAKHRGGPLGNPIICCDIATGRFFDPEPTWEDVPPPKPITSPSTFDQEPPAPRDRSKPDDSIPPF